MNVFRQGGFEVEDYGGHGLSVEMPGGFEWGRPTEYLDLRDVRDLRDALTEWLDRMGAEAAA